MEISDNALAAFYAGKSTKEEGHLILDKMAADENFSEMMDLMSDIDSLDEIEDIRREFDEDVDTGFKYNELNINIK